MAHRMFYVDALINENLILGLYTHDLCMLYKDFDLCCLCIRMILCHTLHRIMNCCIHMSNFLIFYEVCTCMSVVFSYFTGSSSGSIHKYFLVLLQQGSAFEYLA